MEAPAEAQAVSTLVPVLPPSCLNTVFVGSRRGAGCGSEPPSRGQGWTPGPGVSYPSPQVRDACGMRRSGTALSFLLSEVSGRRWPYTGRGGGASQHPCSETPRAAWRPTSQGGNQGPERPLEV